MKDVLQRVQARMALAITVKEFADDVRAAYLEIRRVLATDPTLKRGISPGVGRVRNRNLQLTVDNTNGGSIQGHVLICGPDVVGTADDKLGFKHQGDAKMVFGRCVALLKPLMYAVPITEEPGQTVFNRTFVSATSAMACVLRVDLDLNEQGSAEPSAVSAHVVFYNLSSRKQVNFLKRRHRKLCDVINQMRARK